MHTTTLGTLMLVAFTGGMATMGCRSHEAAPAAQGEHSTMATATTGEVAPSEPELADQPGAVQAVPPPPAAPWGREEEKSKGEGFGAVGTLGTSHGLGGGGARSASRGGLGAADCGNAGHADVARAPLDPNARYATTYRPGRGNLAAFDAAVARGVIPATYRDLVGEFAGPHVAALAAPDGKALRVGVDAERKVLPGNGGSYGLRISLRGHDVAPARARLAVHVVLDTSGSMAGAAIDNARRAAASVVKRLEPSDTFSMVTFGGDASVLVPTGTVGPRRADILGSIDSVAASGGTNISAGLDLAYEQARRGHDGEAVNVVLLLSDGQATAGDTNPTSLAERSVRAFQGGIQTSTFGVGESFDAQLMSTIADRGAGGYYYLSKPEQIASALGAELDARLKPVATGIEVRLRLAGDVKPEVVYGSRQLGALEANVVRRQEVAIDVQEAQRHDVAIDRQEDSNAGMRFFIPAFAARDAHATLIGVRIPGGSGERNLGTLEVKWKDRITLKNEMIELPIKLRHGSAAESQASIDGGVAAAIEAHAAGDALLRAAELAQHGDRATAGEILETQRQRLLAAASTLAQPSLRTDSLRLGRLVGVLRSGSEMRSPAALAMLLRGSGYSYLD